MHRHHFCFWWFFQKSNYLRFYVYELSETSLNEGVSNEIEVDVVRGEKVAGWWHFLPLARGCWWDFCLSSRNLSFRKKISNEKFKKQFQKSKIQIFLCVLKFTLFEVLLWKFRSILMHHNTFSAGILLQMDDFQCHLLIRLIHCFVIGKYPQRRRGIRWRYQRPPENPYGPWSSCRTPRRGAARGTGTSTRRTRCTPKLRGKTWIQTTNQQFSTRLINSIHFFITYKIKAK